MKRCHNGGEAKKAIGFMPEHFKSASRYKIFVFEKKESPKIARNLKNGKSSKMEKKSKRKKMLKILKDFNLKKKVKRV